MDPKSKPTEKEKTVVKEATQAILNVVKTFDILRKGNPLLNNLLDNVKSAIEPKPKKTEIYRLCRQQNPSTANADTQSKNVNKIGSSSSPAQVPVSAPVSTSFPASTPVKIVSSAPILIPIKPPTSGSAALHRIPTPRPTIKVLQIPSLAKDNVNTNPNLNGNANLYQNQFQDAIPKRKTVRFKDDLHLVTAKYITEFYSDVEEFSCKSQGGLKLNTIEEQDYEQDQEENEDLDADVGKNHNSVREHKLWIHPLEPDDGKSSEEKVFETELLDHILNHLPPSDLKACRLVSHKWNLISTSHLLSRNALKISFKFNPKTSSFTKTPTTKTQDENSRFNKNYLSRDLNSLGKLLKNYEPNRNKDHKYIPVFSSQFFSFLGGHLGDPNLQDFLTKYGKLVKHLRLDLIPQVLNPSANPSSLEDNTSQLMNHFKKLLLVQVPQLETLEISNFPQLWFQDASQSQLFPQPQGKGQDNSNSSLSLKSVHFHSLPPRRVLEDILKFSENLHSIYLCRDCSPALNWLVELKKIQLLKSLDILLQPDTFTLYTNPFTIPLSQLCLTKLKFNLDHYINLDPEKLYSATQIISKILLASSHTLEELHTQPLGKVDSKDDNVQLSVSFPKLKLLHFEKTTCEFKKVGKLFPNDLLLSKKFPKLEKIQVDLPYYIFYYKDLDWESKFGGHVSQDCHEIMRKIDFVHGPPASWISSLCEIFPYLTTVRVGLIENFPLAARGFWKLQRLQVLEFAIEVGEDGREFNSYPAIDAGFTGFSEETCLRLYDISREVDVGSLDRLRENPSILDAKYLRKVLVKIHDSGFRKLVDTWPKLPFLSHVSGLFAFEMCPLVHITIQASAENETDLQFVKNGLSPILPYVHSFLDNSN